ncbi:MAG: ubiquitin-conjugating enzyme E2 variant [Nitrososphaerales archaeon]
MAQISVQRYVKEANDPLYHPYFRIIFQEELTVYVEIKTDEDSQKCGYPEAVMVRVECGLSFPFFPPKIFLEQVLDNPYFLGDQFCPDLTDDWSPAFRLAPLLMIVYVCLNDSRGKRSKLS